MNSTGPKTAQNASRDDSESTDPRPHYEPPRITKRRSVARVTQTFSGATGGPNVGGVATEGPP
jgi:hypothetical protein